MNRFKNDLKKLKGTIKYYKDFKTLAELFKSNFDYNLFKDLTFDNKNSLHI